MILLRCVRTPDTEIPAVDLILLGMHAHAPIILNDDGKRQLRPEGLRCFASVRATCIHRKAPTRGL